jgi:hypothetical protein
MIWIKSAAIQTSDGQVFTGINHSQCLVDMKEKKIPRRGRCVQGFITSEDIFVTRKNAVQIAIDAGQIKDQTEVLFSEDLKGKIGFDWQ